MATPTYNDIDIEFFDTKQRKMVTLETRDENKVSIYACGPTVYDHPHLGHGRTAFTYDMIRRFLKYVGYEVTLVSNITDIEDKIINRAKEEGVEEKVITDRYEKSYRDQLDSLGIERPDHVPHATEYVDEMIELISRLLEKGVAYQTSTGVYFSVPDFKDYGHLSGRNIEDLLDSAGARVDVDDEKQSPLDFALWKYAKEGEPTWDSPWGQGRPGWHIECSAMSVGLLNENFDIHGGGSDLVFPHHENEIAQSEGAGDKFAKYWIHSAMLNISGEKMSKSLGNFITLSDAISAHGPRALRLFMIQTHYRTQMEISDESLSAAKSALDRFDVFIRRCNNLEVQQDSQIDEGTQKKFVGIMANDFSTPQALALVFEIIRETNILLDKNEIEKVGTLYRTVVELMNVLGINVEIISTEIDEGWIKEKIQERNNARDQKDFTTSDAIRDELAQHGVILEDTKEGTTWHVETKIK
ncbi:MAG: cysteine--tRNA ligase [Acidimicrobiia bacterium]